MTPHTITLFGETLPIVFNMAVEIAFEEISGEPFDLDALQKQRNALALYMAAITVANKDTAITLDKLLYEAKAEDIITLKEAVWSALADWASIPATANPKKRKKGEDPKNA